MCIYPRRRRRDSCHCLTDAARAWPTYRRCSASDKQCGGAALLHDCRLALVRRRSEVYRSRPRRRRSVPRGAQNGGSGEIWRRLFVVGGRWSVVHGWQSVRARSFGALVLAAGLDSAMVYARAGFPAGVFALHQSISSHKATAWPDSKLTSPPAPCWASLTARGRLPVYHVPIPTCVMAAGLCSVAGMFPDLDSGPGRPLRESLAFAAAIVPMMILHRLRHYGLAPETIIMIGAAHVFVDSLRRGLAAPALHGASRHVS